MEAAAAAVVPAGSVVEPDWHRTPEGKEYFGSLLRRNKRRVFGMVEWPALAPLLAADIAGYKVFVSGKSGVGKTALVAKLAGLEVPSAHHETTGIQTTTVYWPVKLRESGRAVLLRFSFWDCGEAALKRFDHLLPSCTEKVDGLLLLFSFADRASFEDLPGQISRLAEGAGDAVKMVVGTKFDQFAHGDVAEHEVAAFCRAWGLPLARAKSVDAPRLPGGRGLDGRAGLSEVAPLLDRLSEHLWRRDQRAAGLLPPLGGPGTPQELAGDG